MSHKHKGFLALLLLYLFSGGASYAQSLSLSQLTAKMEQARSGVEDLRAQADFAFQLRVGFIPYGDSLRGTYLFQKPDRHKLDFPDAPGYLKSIPSMFNWALPSLDRYNAEVSGPTREPSGERTYKIIYTPKNLSSKTDTIRVTVNAETWQMSQQDTRYRDGGSVLLTFTYVEQNRLPLLEAVSGQLDIVGYKLKGSASITLSSHQVNQGLDEGDISLP